MLKKIPLIIVIGPTASGKTNLAVELAKTYKTEVISSDSRQIYKYLSIGTAKPTEQEMQGVKHHLIDFLNPEIDYSAGIFEDDATQIIHTLNALQKIPIIAGGSGLYVKALVEGLFGDNKSEKTKQIRNELSAKLSEHGKEYLFEELQRIDPASALKYADKNSRRIIRALEFYYSEGKLFSEAHQEDKIKDIFYPIYLALDWDREIIYDRINLRTQLMWEQGLIEETEKVLSMGYDRSLNALNTVGYKECISFLDGNMSQTEAIEEMKKNTRRYAKRQLTWNRRIQNVNYIDATDSKLVENAKEIINKTIGAIDD